MTGLMLAKDGERRRIVQIRSIEVPDLWHLAMLLIDKDNPARMPLVSKKVLECWHLAHDMKNALQALDKVLPVMLGRATERIYEYITDIQEMGDIEQRTVDNLEQWVEELKMFMAVFEYFPMDEDFMGDERSCAEVYIEEALQLRDEIKAALDRDTTTQYANVYDCPCGHHWVNTWTATCNDKCPACNKEIEPTSSAEVTT